MQAKFAAIAYTAKIFKKETLKPEHSRRLSTDRRQPLSDRRRSLWMFWFQGFSIQVPIDAPSLPEI